MLNLEDKDTVDRDNGRLKGISEINFANMKVPSQDNAQEQQAQDATQ